MRCIQGKDTYWYMH